jgi:hydroxymethylbilane synthase
MATLKMGTRGSALALAQSGQAARALEALHPGLRVETVVIKTSGDLFGAPPPDEARELPQGAKGLWVKEIESALLEGAVDFACHSAKDLPSALAPGLAIAAYPEREDPRDCLVARPGLSWSGLKAGMRLGTSSLRRQLLAAEAVPGLAFEPLRGNVDTRLRKLSEGAFDAMILATAGLKRLGRWAEGMEPLDPAAMIPSPAQGSLALEVRADRREIASLVGALDHAETRLRVEFEREFLAAVGGGCGAPVAAHAVVRGGGVALAAFYAAEGEKSGRRVEGYCADPARREPFVRDLAARARAR